MTPAGDAPSVASRFSMTDRTALVTGASRGIGRAIALGMAGAGADLVLASRKAEALETVAHEVEALGRRARVIPVHTGREDSIDALAEALRAQRIPVDVLVNNAATNPVMGPLIDLEPRAWQKVIDTNLTGPFLLARAVVPGMIERGRGVILNIASNGGIRPAPGIGAYCISKAALIYMTRVLARELGPKGIRVNALAPGLVETRFSEALLTEEGGYREFVAGNPLRRHAQPDEIVGAALMLASDAGSYTTGEVVVIDGGSTL